MARKKTQSAAAETETTAATQDTTRARDGRIKTRVADLPEGLSSYWRGGVAHSKDWREWPEHRFTPEQLEKVKADPRIEVG